MGILLGRTVVGPDQRGVDGNEAVMLIDNVFRRGAVTASSEDTATNGWLENAIDGQTFDWWQPTALPAWLQTTQSTAQPVDCGLIAVHNSLTFVFQYHDGSGWVNLHDPVESNTTAVVMVVFSEVIATQFRIRVTEFGGAGTDAYLGVVMLGKSIRFPRRFYGGHAPITLNRTTDMVPIITEGGLEKGIMTLRTGASTSVTVQHCPATWVRDNLDGINNALRILPFGFAWRPVTHPDDVAYCWLNKEIRATNNGIRDLMDLAFDFDAYVGGFALQPAIEYFFTAQGATPYSLMLRDLQTEMETISSPDTAVAPSSCIVVHQNGIVVTANRASGARAYLVSRSGEWTLLQDEFTGTGDVSTLAIHPDDAKYLIINSKLFLRCTISGDEVYAFIGAAPFSGFAKWSPDGEILTIVSGTSFYNYSFNLDNGDAVLIESIAIDEGYCATAWSNDSAYFAITNYNTFGGVELLKIYKRDFDDDTMTRLTINDPVTSGMPTTGDPLSAREIHHLAWHPDGGLLIVGTDDTESTIWAFQNDGDDTFSDVTETVVADVVGEGGRIFAVEWSSTGDRLVVGVGDNSLGSYVGYSYSNGVLSKEYSYLTAQNVRDIRRATLSGSPIPGDDLYDESIWSPLQIIGDIDFWVDFSNPLTVASTDNNDNKISRVADLSQNAILIQQGTSNNQPTLVDDGHPDLNVAYFDPGVAIQHLEITGHNMTARATTFFIVAKMANDPAAAAGESGLFRFTSSSFNQAYPWIDGVIYENYGVTVRQTVGNPAPDLSDWNIYEIESNTGIGGWKAKLNGTTIYSSGSSLTLDGFDVTAYLGLSANACKGWIGEVVMLNGVDSESIEKIEGYLAWKWGLDDELPGGHPYKDEPPPLEDPT